jgi:hypothetical protein
VMSLSPFFMVEGQPLHPQETVTVLPTIIFRSSLTYRLVCHSGGPLMMAHTACSSLHVPSSFVLDDIEVGCLASLRG